jgi:hypothetical protein
VGEVRGEEVSPLAAEKFRKLEQFKRVAIIEHRGSCPWDEQLQVGCISIQEHVSRVIIHNGHAVDGCHTGR